jgi:uncharacterized protein (DUF58 family)
MRFASGALLDRVRGVHWPARRLTIGSLHGGHRSRRVGSSPEFMDYRPYQQGDDPARIDWKLFGRTERVLVRRAHDDSSLRTTIVLDASASMAFPVASHAKWQLAASIALGLCAVAHGDGDPVGLVVTNGDGIRELSPRTRRGTVADALRLLAGVEPSGSPRLTPVMAALGANRRLAILSDFLGDAASLLAVSRQLIAAGREVFAVHVVAADEIDPAPHGVVIDPEDAAVRRPLGEADLASYRTSFARWREALAAAWLDAGANFQLVVTSEAPERAVRRIVAPLEVSSTAV